MKKTCDVKKNCKHETTAFVLLSLAILAARIKELMLRLSNPRLAYF